MAYDDQLAMRLRRVLVARPSVTEKNMFGGLAFFFKGKMFCGIIKDELVVRVGPDRYEESLSEAHTRPMDFTGRPMNGYVYVEPEGCRNEKAVKAWVERGAEFVATLKSAKPKKSPRKRSPAKRKARAR